MADTIIKDWLLISNDLAREHTAMNCLLIAFLHETVACLEIKELTKKGFNR